MANQMGPGDHNASDWFAATKKPHEGMVVQKGTAETWIVQGKQCFMQAGASWTK